AKRPSGKQVCVVKRLSKSFGEKQLFQTLTFEALRGDRTAIMGVNGIGKSTLIKTLMGIIKQDEGTVDWGTEVRLSYFSQDHHELLNCSKTVFHWLHEAVSESNEQQVRKILGQMLFTKEDVDKDILSLSGGEAARLLLAKVMLELPNVLI